MILHPRIKELSKIIENVNAKEVLSLETFENLLKHGATATEASITIHLMHSIPLDEVWNYINTLKIFPIEEINDSAMQTFTYMFYKE